MSLISMGGTSNCLTLGFDGTMNPANARILRALIQNQFHGRQKTFLLLDLTGLNYQDEAGLDSWIEALTDLYTQCEAMGRGFRLLDPPRTLLFAFQERKRDALLEFVLETECRPIPT